MWKKKVLISSTPLILEKKLLLKILALVVLPRSNNFQNNVRKIVKICIQAIWEKNFTISLSNLGAYIEKIKVKYRPPRRRTPKKKFKASVREKRRKKRTNWSRQYSMLSGTSFISLRLFVLKLTEVFLFFFFLTGCTYSNFDNDYGNKVLAN